MTPRPSKPIVVRAYTSACALVLASVLVPALASASIARGPETRVWGFDFENAALVGVESSQALESRRAYELWYGGSASDSTVAPNRGGGLVPSQGAGRTRLVYSIRDAEGRVTYVGRASGKGTPQQVLSRRISTHEHKAAGRFQIEDLQESYQANRGAEEAIFQRARLAAEAEGRSLLNKDLPISPRNAKQGTYVDAYYEEWLRSGQ